MTDHTIKTLKIVYNKYGKGNLLTFDRFLPCLEKLCNIMNNTNTSVDHRVAYVIFLLADEDKSGDINFDEFQKFWVKRHYYFGLFSKKDRVIKSYNLFKKYSTHGCMSIHQFVEMMDELGVYYEENDFNSINRNDDDVITFDEFVQWLKWY